LDVLVAEAEALPAPPVALAMTLEPLEEAEAATLEMLDSTEETTDEAEEALEEAVSEAPLPKMVEEP
jgi:hypothetical protein